MADNTKLIGGFTYRLAGSGVSATATTIILTSFTFPQTDRTITSSDIGSIEYATLEPGNDERQEFISFTGITQNADGTATLTGVTRGLTPFEPYTESTDYKFAHGGGTALIISDTPQKFAKFLARDNDETITGIYTFTTVPNSSSDPVSSDDLARRSWVLSQINGGAVSTDNVIVAGTAGETVVAGNVLYLKTADGRWWKADGDLTATIDDVIIGIAQGAGTAGVAISGGVLLQGVDANQTSRTAGATQYVGNTAGSVVETAGTLTRAIGVGHTTSTKIYFNPYFFTLPTYKQKQALANLTTYSHDYGGASAIGTDAYAITLSPIPTAYTAGMKVSFKTDVANTGAATLNVNSLGAKNIYKRGNLPLDTGDIIAGQMVVLEYDGTQFQLVSPTRAINNKLYLTTTPVTVGNTVTETTLLTTTIPANNLGTNDGVDIDITITPLTRTASTNTLTLRLKYGGTTVAALVYQPGTGVTTGYAAKLIGNILAVGATNSQKGYLHLTSFTESATGTSTVVGTFKAGTAAVDSTADQTLAITAEWGAADSNLTLTLTEGVVTRIN